jgi:HSP20 family protein
MGDSVEGDRKEVWMAHTITRWDPFGELADMRTRFDRLLGDLADGDRDWMPAVDVIREDGKLVVRAELPGIKPEEVEVKVDDDVLTIAGKHEETTEEQEKDFVRRERRYGAFSRRISLPAGVDAKKIKATTTDGVLEVTVPLPKEATHEPVTIKPTAA